MFVLVRTVTYASGFIGLLLVLLTARILTAAGIARPATAGPLQIASLVLAALGAALATWCILAFTFAGKGTPAPFDPPRRLVIVGPYRHLRNPMYVGAVLLLGGAAGYYGSLGLLEYAAGFFVATHLFVIAYEEPTLTRKFGDEYLEYRKRVGRWWPRLRRRP